jgi:16S rRNA (uracil1498-N3)-methyltransferase
MPDFRAYAPEAVAAATEIRLAATESHHLVVVNRCQRGDLVVAFDGRGREWQCECVDTAKSGAVLRVKSTHPAAPLPSAITLAQSLPKGPAMDEIVRQATELGAARIVPLLTERTQVHLDGDREEKKIEKWRVAAIEAAKQCGNPWVPEIGPLQTLEELLGPGADDFDLKLVASLHAGARPLRGVIDNWRAEHNRPPRRALWLVGPEGDFSPAEMAACAAAGCVPVTLGSLVLRCDTAAVAALSVLSYELSAN